MSLVAYEYSSDEESAGEEPEATDKTVKQNGNATTETTNVENEIEREPESVGQPKHLLHLPAPKHLNDLSVEEEDDEFLRKKALPAEIPLPKPPTALPAKPKVRNGKVQITIPSMKEFLDGDDAQGTKKGKPMIGAALPQKTTNLLSLLPKPRSALFETKPAASTGPTAANTTSFSKRLVPDSVANRPRSVPVSAAKPGSSRSAGETSKKPPKATTQPANSEDEEDEDDADDQMVDFFSFNKVDELPTVSTNEISAMVAKKAAKIAENVRKFTEPEEQPEATHLNEAVTQETHYQPDDGAQDLASETALSALIGGNRAKRARIEEVDLIEITSSDIVPSKEDFLRRQLQDETGYVPTGHLVGDWTCTSKRKSHITQLANKAQANAQELEAMWAANRQSRRQTQSKYGF
uniref:Proline-rich protein PRCC n=1 Tax=Anopheles dirus TaxID=7168 RepID=A0A182NK97_9DIPT